MALSYYGYKSNAYGASASASDPYFSYQTVSSGGDISPNISVSSIDACSISNANTNGSSSSGYRMNIEVQLNGTWYTIGYITVSGQTSSHQTFSGFTSTADASLLSLMGKVAPAGLRGKVVNGYFHLNAGSTLNLSATTKSDASPCAAPTALSLDRTYAESNVSLSGSGASGGNTNAIAGYEIQCAESSDGSNWGAWSAYTTVSTNSGSFVVSVAPSGTRGAYRKYRVRTLGSAGEAFYSGWKETSNSVRRYVLSSFAFNVTSIEAGGTITATITQPGTEVTHKITWQFGSRSSAQSLGSTKTASLTPPPDWLDQIPTATSGTATCTIEATLGGAVVSSDTKSFTITCPASVIPSLASFTASRINNAVPSAWGVYIQGISQAYLQISGEAGVYGSYITAYSISGGGFSAAASYLTTGVFNTSGTFTFTARVTDSRGRYTEKTLTVTVETYNAPAITATNAFRCNASGVEALMGTYGSFKLNYTFDSRRNNAVTTRIEYRLRDTVNWTTLYSTTLANGQVVVINGGFDYAKSYDIRFTLSDAINTLYAQDSITSAAFAFHLRAGGNGAAFGKMAELANTLEVSDNWKLKLGTPLEPQSGGTGKNSLLEGFANLAYRGFASNMDTAWSNGVYYVTPDTNRASFPASLKVNGAYGVLLVVNSQGSTHDNAANWLYQVFITTNYPTSLWVRNKINNGTFSPWHRFSGTVD